MKTENEVLRENARLKLKGNLGQNILAVIVPGILAIIADGIFGTFAENTTILYLVLSVTTSSIAGYMSIKMVMHLARGNKDAQFGESLSPGNRLGKFVLYSLIIASVALIINIPTNLIFSGSWLGNTEAMQSTISTFGNDTNRLFGFLFGYLGITFVGAIAVAVLLVRLTFVTYIITDEETTIMDAIRKSLRITQGNFWRIIGMQLSFIGWFLLIIVTCGIAVFYVAPYYQMAMMNLYFAVSEENNEGFERTDFSTLVNDEYEPVQKDWADESKDNNENSWDF